MQSKLTKRKVLDFSDSFPAIYSSGTTYGDGEVIVLVNTSGVGMVINIICAPDSPMINSAFKIGKTFHKPVNEHEESWQNSNLWTRVTDQLTIEFTP